MSVVLTALRSLIVAAWARLVHATVASNESMDVFDENALLNEVP